MKAENPNQSESILNIRDDKAFVRHLLEELKMVRVKRWGGEGEEKFTSEEEFFLSRENNMEHVGAMKNIADKIFLKADAEGDGTILNLDFRKVSNLIRIHDLEENYAGDAREKDEDFYKREAEATDTLHENNKNLNFAAEENALMEEYRKKETPETHFVKALDELQAWLHLISKRDTDESNRNLDNLTDNKGYQCAQEFPTLKRVMEIVTHMMQRSELIKSPIPEMPE